MTNFRFSYNRPQDEAGVILPLAAVILGTLIIIFVSFAIDVKRVKEARAQADYVADQICSLVVRALPIQKNAIDQAFGILGQFDEDPGDPAIDLSGHTTITKVRIIAPTMDDGLGTPAMAGDNPVAGCPADPGLQCLFKGDVAGTAYPAAFWDQSHVGGYIACEVETESRTIVSSDKNTNARVAYWVRMPGPVRLPNTEKSSATLIISPEFEIYSDPGYADRFNFSGALTTAPDPLAGGNPAFSSDRSAFLDPFFGANFSPSARPIDPSPELKSMLRRCYNPMLAVRNTLLQSMVARLARHWESFDNTRILATSPMHVGVGFTGPSFPVQIVDRGQDTLIQGYQLPYINYQADDKGSSGFLCPFDNCPPGPATANHHMLVVSQLRDCQYVSTFSGGIETLEDTTIGNGGFEDPNIASLSQVAVAYPGQSDWGFAGLSPTLGTAEDLMRIIPNVENCPFEFASDATITPACTKSSFAVDTDPNLAPPGLRPDIAAALKFAKADSGDLGSAYPSPGFFNVPVVGPVGSPIPNPDAVDPSVNLGPIILVLSRRIPTLEVALVKSEVNGILAQGRSIMVIYLPTNSIDADPIALTNLKDAFAVTGPNSVNKVIMLAPADCAGITESQCFRDYWEDLLLDTGPRSLPEIAKNIWEMVAVFEVAR